MKAVVLLMLIGLASCRADFIRNSDRDVEVKYKFDDDYDREVEVDFDDRPAAILRPLVVPVVQRRPETVHRFVQVSAAPAPQFRTRVVPVAAPPAAAQVLTEAAPVQIVASQPQVFTQPQQIVPVAPQATVQVLASQPQVFTQPQQIVPVVPQAPVFVQDRVVPVVSAPRNDVVTQYVRAEHVPVVPAPSVPIVTPPRATFVAERRDIFRPRDDSSEK
ncbi:DNA translocase FtsK-like [Macrobrachium nipponense]|uniref:DNA translocase FtsK-like n=1 Tax=Macrobrachium nipponense TaxID=159736 RepID=UPI0030C878C3